ncbi:MAG TPA: hypothetical protein ENI87_05965 [bacterium]|nr:hypothetical protein [bacterium]
MDFFGHQEQARRRSARLVWLFVAAVLCIIALIYVAAKITLIATKAGDDALIDWPVLGAVTAAVAVLVGGATLFKTAQLRSGGGRVAEMLGGRLVEIDTKDPKERMLRNVVEEMAIASGLPVPDIYVLDNETGINAFAAGWSPADAAVAVTRGSLEAFTRDELQGVIAHEFSHVFHGDMRLNIRLMGTLFGIVCIAVIGRILLRSMYYSGGGRSRSKDKGGAAGIMVFGLLLVVIGYVGVFFARLIQAAVSRQREYLADASAVQYTRNPRGIGLALAKIAGIGGRLKSAHTEEASHMLFADGISKLGGGLATHPPLEDRIERVLPGFLKQLDRDGSPEVAVANTPLPAAFATAGAAGLAGGSSARQVVDSVGAPGARHVTAAHDLLAALPLDLKVGAQEPARAPALLFALLLDDVDEVRSRQLQLLAEHDRWHHDAAAWYRHVRRLDRRQRLPLLELLMPTLRRLPAEDRAKVRHLARALALADDDLSPFEFALLKSLERHVRIAGESPRRPNGRPIPLAARREAAALVLSVIAHAGADGEEGAAATAFRRGADELSLPDVRLVAREAARPEHLDRAIDELADVSPFGKRNLIAACAEVAAIDGRLDPDEVDLVRALGELWDCPVPLPIPAQFGTSPEPTVQ